MKVMYTLTGIVVRGKGLGHTVGMPTANLETSDTIPPYGVYASYVYIDSREKRYIGVTNIGLRPSVDNENAVTIETNILDFDEDIYGSTLTLEIMSLLRPTIQLDSLKEVKKQVDRDKDLARILLS